MKNLVLGFYLLLFSLQSIGQAAFILNFEQPIHEHLNDVIELNNQFYFVQKRSGVISTPGVENNYTDIIITSSSGEVEEIIDIFDFESWSTRILKQEGDDLILITGQIYDTCLSRIALLKFNIQTREITPLSSYDLCHSTIENIRIVKGLDHSYLLFEYHYNFLTDDIEKNIFLIDTLFKFNLLFEDIFWRKCISIDFSGKGYVLCNTGLYDFYDRNFNYRKQRYKSDNLNAVHEAFIPFGQGLMLEQSVQAYSAEPDQGLTIRLVDSNLHVIKKLAILPPSHAGGFIGINPPFYGGLDVIHENEIWSAGFFDLYFFQDTSVYVVSKLDSNLQIICQHFIGYDNHYRLYGIRALERGGAVVYGSRIRDGLTANGGEDVYAIRVGENCELPTTSIHDPDYPLIYISVYPNPTINSLTFDVNGFDPSALRVEIFNTSGIVVFSHNDLSYEIQVAELPAGQYFYRILRDQQVLGAGPWIKQ